jgi:hypothetical protein
MELIKARKMENIKTLHNIYRMSQEECARLREDVPYVKVYRYNPKHLYPKLNGYGDNGQRQVWSSGGSTHCTCQLTVLSCRSLRCGFKLRQSERDVVRTINTRENILQMVQPCYVSAGHSVSRIVLGTLRTTMT